MSTFGINPTYFPPQKKTEKEKDEKWFKECIDTGIGLAQWGQGSIRSANVRTTRKNKIINYNLRNDIIDPTEIERVTNPFGLQIGDFPNNYKNYPLINPALNLLTGEERRRIFFPIVSVINSDAVSNKVRRITEIFQETAIKKLVSPDFNEEQTKKEIQEFDKFRKYNFKDIHERMGSQVLKYLYHTQDLSEEFSRGFEDLLIAAEEIYVIQIIGGEPILRKGNPLNFYTLRSGNSWKFEDSDIIVEDQFIPIGKVIDWYHEYLTEENIKNLEDGHNGISNTSSSMFSNQLNYPVGGTVNDIIPNVEIVDNWNSITGYYSGAFDPEGNVRVTRVLWRGMRKIKIIQRFDENGEIVKDIMPEQYKPNKELGEQVKEEWINEWYEGTRISTDIYVKMEPCEIQMRHKDNPSICNPGIIGTVFNVNSNVGRSLYDEGRDLQYLYNLFMYRLELAFTKYKGRIGKLPLHLVPDGWTVDKWLYYAEYLGWAVVDAFNESQKPSFRGKPAGIMQEGSSIIDLEMGNYIQNHISMLDFIERRLADLIGVTPQRKGAIDNRETVGGVERSVQQSSLVTEKWYSIHDNTRKRALRALIEAAKIAWRDKSFVKEFVLDDGTKEILEFDYSTFVESTYGVDVTNSSNDIQALQAMKSLADRFLQNGGSFAIIADIYRTNSITDVQRKIETYEEQLRQSQEQSKEQELAVQQQYQQQLHEMEMYKLQLESQEKELDRELKQYEIDSNNETKIAVAEIGNYFKDPTLDTNNNNIPDAMEIANQALKERESSSNIFDKEMNRKLKEMEIQNKKNIEDEKLKLQNKDLDLREKLMKHEEKMQKLKDKNALQREKIKSNTALKNKVSGEK